jgi:cytochrome oxidase Cu insertion factor (SCO1/SenC/PrrC family)
MGLVVWIAGRRARAVVESSAEPAAIQVATETQPTPQKPSPALWDKTGVKDFTFTERSGRQVTKADLLGHPWLVSFIFTRCAGPCPRVSGRMADLQRLLMGTDVKLVTLTVDPDFDKPEVLNRYAQSFGADANRWLYLTGDKEKTYRLINDSFKMPVKELTGKDREPGYEVLHSVNILRVNEKGVVVAKYNALDDADVVRLEHDLKPYIEQATQNRAKPDSVTPAKRDSH